MKKYLLIIFLFLFIGSAQAQDDSETETLFGKGVKISGFGGPTLNWTFIDSRFGLMVGGGGGVIFNQKFFFGGFGNGLTTPVRSFYDDRRLSFGYGGFWTGYHFKPKKLIHLVASAKLGWGSAGFDNPSLPNEDFVRDHVFIAEPEIGAEVNLTKFFKISVGCSYRYVSPTDLAGFSGNRLSGPAINTSFKFGMFN